jgi:hypothetical protein
MPPLTPFQRITLAVKAQIPLVHAMEAALGLAAFTRVKHPSKPRFM